jgi:hypothetical protein
MIDNSDYHFRSILVPRSTVAKIVRTMTIKNKLQEKRIVEIVAEEL